MKVADVERVVRSRLGGIIRQVHKITDDTDKPNVQEGIAWAMRRLGYSAARVDRVTDAEAALVAAADTDALLDLSELAVLRAIPGNLPAIDTQTGPMRLTISSMSKAIEEMIARRTREIIIEHGKRVPGLQDGERRIGRIVSI